MARDKRIAHIVGTGTIGEPLIGILTNFSKDLGIDEVTFSKKQALHIDRSKVVSLIRRGAKLCSEPQTWEKFSQLGMQPTYSIEEAFRRAAVIIDCTPTGVGNENKQEFYNRYVDNTLGFIAQGSEFGFGKMYARGINDRCLEPGKDRFIQVVSCNTHNLAVLIKTLGIDTDGNNHLEEGRFVCIRRANDISQDSGFVPSAVTNQHDDETFGTHHARDAYHLFKTLGVQLNVYSSAMKFNTQYMHTIWFNLKLDHDITLDEVIEKLAANPLVALTYKRSAGRVFSFGRDHGHYGRLLNQTVVVRPSLTVRKRREIVGFCFTPQDGNALLSSVAAITFFLDPDRYEQKIQCLAPYFFDEV